MKPQEFVKRVMHAQEGVLLDPLYPSDDMYREIMTWLQTVIEEFILMEDWSFLRESIILGPTDPEPGFENKVPKFTLPKHIDRVCMLFDDSLKLHTYKGHPHHNYYNINEDDFLCVPYASKGFERKRRFLEPAKELQARVFDNYIEFNRSCIGNELGRVAVCDCQVKPHIPHVCDDTCKANKYKDANGNWTTEIDYSPDNYHPCNKIEKDILSEFPKQQYFVLKTAYYSAMSSPIAAATKMDLDNSVKQILSNMRKLDAAKTSPDYLQNDALFIPYSVF